MVSGNTISGGRSGISVVSGSMALDGNEVTGASGRGIAIGGDSPVLTNNMSCGNEENLWVADTATPAIDDSNEICDDEVAE